MNDFEERIKRWRDEFEEKYGRKPTVIEYTEAKQRIHSEIEIDSIKQQMQNTQGPGTPKKKKWPWLIGIAVAIIVIGIFAFIKLGSSNSDQHQSESSGATSSVDSTALSKDSSSVTSSSSSKSVSQTLTEKANALNSQQKIALILLASGASQYSQTGQQLVASSTHVTAKLMNPAYFENNGDGADGYLITPTLGNTDGNTVIFIKDNRVMLAIEGDPASMSDLESSGRGMEKTTTELYSENGKSNDFKQLTQLVTVDNNVSDE